MGEVRWYFDADKIEYDMHMVRRISRFLSILWVVVEEEGGWDPDCVGR